MDNALLTSSVEELRTKRVPVPILYPFYVCIICIRRSFYIFVRKLILHGSMPGKDSQNGILARFVNFSQPKPSVKSLKKVFSPCD